MKSISKKKALLLIFEGFILYNIIVFVCGYYVASLITQYFADLPDITVRLLLPSTIPPIITISYLWLRLRYTPKIVFDIASVYTAIAGIVCMWLLIFLGIFIFGKNNGHAQAILQAYPYYFELNLFLYILWTPFIEEILFRAYIIEILKSAWSVKSAIMISSLIFSLGHTAGIQILLNGDIRYILSFLFVFLGSVVLSAAYIRSGLLASTIIHVFANAYIFLLNKG